MNVIRDAIEKCSQDHGMVSIQGWCYDLVLERLERMGFVCLDRGVDGLWEGSTYRHPQKGEFKVATNRFTGPMTVIQFFPSSKEPGN